MLITEVMAQPETGQPEWVEVLNPDDSAQVITGFVLKDLLTSPSVLYTFPEVTVGPGEYFVVELSGSKLNNGGDGVHLYNNQGILVDEMAFSSSQKGISWQKYAQGWCESAPTPGVAHTCPEPTPTPTPTPSATPKPSATPTPPSNTAVSASPTPPSSPLVPLGNAQPTTSLERADKSAEIDAKLASLKRLFLPPESWQVPEKTPILPATPPPESATIDITSPQAGRLFPSRLVIMGGLLVVASIFVPDYAQIKSFFTRLGQRFTAAGRLGPVHLYPERPIDSS